MEPANYFGSLARYHVWHRDLLKRLSFYRQALHAAELGFVHPVTKNRLSFASGIPADMQELFSALGV